jgi:SAM-dependent methyltransferase
MLAEAERKGVYRSLVEARLGERLPYEDASYDAVVSSGVLTTGHAPASSLDELARITRAGGHVVFTLRSDETPPGYDEKIAELLARARWELVERGDEFQAMPTSEPDVLVRVWAFRVS